MLDIGSFSCVQIIRGVIEEHTGRKLPLQPPLPSIASYGTVQLTEHVSLIDSIPWLYPGDGIPVKEPDILEEFGVR
jgi:hypothetical protein